LHGSGKREGCGQEDDADDRAAGFARDGVAIGFASRTFGRRFVAVA
jgi:hypothetical protein